MFGTWMRRSKVLTPSNTGETPCFEKCLDWMKVGNFYPDPFGVDSILAATCGGSLLGYL